jgi:hypothetical protein
MKVSPFRTFIQKLFELRLKFKKEGNKVGDDMVKLLMNSLYGKTVQRDIDTQIFIWSTKTLKDNYDETILSRHKIQNDMWIVEKKKEKKNIDVSRQSLKEGLVKSSKKEKTSSQVPLHLGSFILAHSRRIMNNFLLAIDAYKNPRQHYGDTDSTYIGKKHYETLNKLNYVGGNLCQGKNDYGDGGIIFGLHEASKIKYGIVLNDGVLSEKKTFKGLMKEMKIKGKTIKILKTEDFFKLDAGETVVKKIMKPWTRNLGKGVRKPEEPEDEEDKENRLAIKKFDPNFNILKRRPADENGIMYPYYISENGIMTKQKPWVELTDNYNENLWNEYGFACSLFDKEVELKSPNEVRTEFGVAKEGVIITEVVEEELPLIEEIKEDINITRQCEFKQCTKCQEVKSMNNFSHPSWCSSCMKQSHEKWLANNPNAQKANQLRTWLSLAIKNSDSSDKNNNVEEFTGLPINKLKEWMNFTKQFYIPKGYKGQIDIEHQYCLSKYDLSNENDIKFCLNFKHLRYTTHVFNLKKLNKPPTPLDKFKQAVIVSMFLKNQKNDYSCLPM